jgi:hypothetical protein
MRLEDVPVHRGPFDIPYVRTSELPEEYRKAYSEWLCGQTRPVIPGASDASYSWDFATFREKVIHGLPYDWD